MSAQAAFGLLDGDTVPGGDLGQSPRRPFGSRVGWVDHGDVDALGSQLVGQILGQGSDRDISYRANDLARLSSSEAADVDDAAPPGGRHVRRRFAGRTQIAQHLDIDVFPERLLG